MMMMMYLLSKLKMLRSMSHEIVNNKNTVSFTSDAKSTGIKSNGEYDSSTIERIIERLNDNEEKDNKPMSMEEYRLVYTSEFFEAAVNDEETILKKTINEVDCQIYCHSDTTITTVTSDCVISSDSEPEIIIHRTKSNRKKKKKIYHQETTYLQSAAKFGFPLRKILPEQLREKCLNQEWSSIEIKSGLKEGRGVFANKCIKKNVPLCNYGGVHVSRYYAEKYLLPDEDKCNYLVELLEKTSCGMEIFYMNYDPKNDNSYGQLLNHSSLHPNTIPKIYATGKGKLEIVFFSKRDIRSGEEITWDYGRKYNGVGPCVQSCRKCK